MKPTRRSFFALAGVTPFAAKATVDAEIAKSAAIGITGMGDTTFGLGGGLPDAGDFEKKLVATADYIKMFGIPPVIEQDIRVRARSVYALDPDLACKQSWSMSVKILTQRQRNYQRMVDQMKDAGWQQRGRAALKKLIGFNWPW